LNCLWVCSELQLDLIGVRDVVFLIAAPEALATASADLSGVGHAIKEATSAAARAGGPGGVGIGNTGGNGGSAGFGGGGGGSIGGNAGDGIDGQDL
jgi:hypothetical protein